MIKNKLIDYTESQKIVRAKKKGIVVCFNFQIMSFNVIK